MSKIILIEDEPELSRIICEWLAEDRHLVEACFDGEEALQKLQRGHYDLVILDWMLPSLSGVDICRGYRQSGGSSPILMLTARRALANKEVGLDAGADDYLTKPFKLRELSARVRALLRRPARLAPEAINIGPLAIDLGRRQVTKNGMPLSLLPKEFALLEMLARHQGEVLSVETLTHGVWSDQNEVSPDTIRSHIRALRKKLGDREEGSIIQNVHGAGYRLSLGE